MHRMNIRAITLAAAVVAVGLLAGCGSSSKSSTAASGSAGSSTTAASSGGTSTAAASSSSGGTFNVVYITGLSGPLQVYGVDGLKGIKAAAATLNASGGILGHRVVVTAKDDASTPSNAVTELNSALTSGTKPNIVIDGLTGDEGLAMAGLASQAHVIAMNLSALPNLDDVQKFPYQFAGLPSYASEGHAIAEGLTQHGIKTVNVLYPQEANGQQETSVVDPILKSSGITVVGTTGYSPTALDITPVWLRAAASHPQGYVLITAGQAPVALNSRAKAGITAYTQCDTTCAANPLSALVKHAGLVNAWTFNPPLLVTPPAQRTPAEKTFITQITKLGFPPDIGVPSLEYDFLLAVNEAAQQAKSIDETALLNALDHLNSPQAFASGMRVQYSPTSHYPVPDTDVTVWKLFPTTDRFVGDVYLPAQ
jgi:branched-chain amino acid transport system substrate-binding protein